MEIHIASPMVWKRRFSEFGIRPLPFFRAQVTVVWQCPLSTGMLMR